jgi:hypothetical protein
MYKQTECTAMRREKGKASGNGIREEGKRDREN